MLTMESISGIIPFNEQRFDACMAHIIRRANVPLTKYDMVKLHVLIDVYHTLHRGKPIIGGALERWPHGPVVKKAYDRVDFWDHRHQESGQQPRPFLIFERHGSKTQYGIPANAEVEDPLFSPAELRSIEDAWRFYESLGKKAYDFFHSEDTFIGKAWAAAKVQGNPVNWMTIIDAYDAEFQTDHSHIKALIRR
jgi:hypothetical protein